MRISRLFVEQSLVEGGVVELPKDRHHYLCKVLRLKVGHPVIVFNGHGGEYEAVIDVVSNKSSTLKLLKFCAIERESNCQLTLVQGLARGSKMDWVIQKAVELGVATIVPVFTERSSVKLEGERLQRRVEHWRDVVISACEQSGRNTLPNVVQPQTLPEYLTGLSSQPGGNEKRFILDLDSAQPMPASPLRSVSLLVGPEGGFSEEEVRHAKQSDFVSIKLGARVLRSETAGLAALTAAQCLYGDLCC